MGNYGYLGIGILLGIAVSVYIYVSREEKIEKEIAINKKIFSTKLLDAALERSVEKMKTLINERNKELSEEEKNEIIFDCFEHQKNNMKDDSKANENC